MTFDRRVLEIDPEAEAARIAAFLAETLGRTRRSGYVLGLSGGVDSALAAGLLVRAVGPGKVLALHLPERDSSPQSGELARAQAAALGLRLEEVDITPVLTALGAYERRDRVVRGVFPDYKPEHKMRITLPPDLLAADAYNVFTLTVEDGEGRRRSARLKKAELAGIVAATSMKHRTRMTYLYFYAELGHALVCGTTNRTEAVLGYFVKHGDGGVDLEPLAHLYKTQVFRMAAASGVIPGILNRPPSPDTFSLPTSDEEFYYRMPIGVLDHLLYAWENGVPQAEAGRELGLTEEQVGRAFRDFASKFRSTEVVRASPPTLLQGPLGPARERR